MNDNPIQAALENWDKLKSNYESLEQRYNQTNRILEETTFKLEHTLKELQKVTNERDMYQRYAIGLHMRLTVLQENIRSIMTEAEKSPYKALQEKIEDAKASKELELELELESVVEVATQNKSPV